MDTRETIVCSKHGAVDCPVLDETWLPTCPDCEAGYPEVSPEEKRKRTLEAMCRARFGRSMWHTVIVLTGNVPGVNPCYWCNEPATKEALVNIWGSVHVTPACEKCWQKNDGKMRDDL